MPVKQNLVDNRLLTLTFVLQIGFGRIITVTVETRDKNKNDRDVGMKKAQKQDIIQNGTIFGILYPFLHSTQYNYYSQIMASLWNVGMGIEFQILFHSE